MKWFERGLFLLKLKALENVYVNGITAFLHVSRLKFIIGYLGKSINFFALSAPKYLFLPSPLHTPIPASFRHYCG